VEATVGGVVVLDLASLAHREARHRRERTVVGQRADDREARPAVRAGDERVPEAPVAGVEQLPPAVLADRDVGGDERGDRTPARLGTITNRSAAASERTDGSSRVDHSSRTGSSVTTTVATRASGGASSRTRRTKTSIAAGSPSTSMKTPSASLPTSPPSWS
jgi:hypothetical protein